MIIDFTREQWEDIAIILGEVWENDPIVDDSIWEISQTIWKKLQEN